MQIDKAYSRDFMQRGRVRVLLKKEDGTLYNPAISSSKGQLSFLFELEFCNYFFLGYTTLKTAICLNKFCMHCHPFFLSTWACRLILLLFCFLACQINMDFYNYVHIYVGIMMVFHGPFMLSLSVNAA